MAPGWLTVGSEVDSMRAAHAFHAIPVVGESHWGVKVHDVSIPGLSSANICNPSCAAIVDSGTSLITAPPDADGMLRELAELVAPDCSNVADLPVIRFQLDGVLVELPPATYVMQSIADVTSSVWDRFVGGQPAAKTVRCVTAFMSIDKLTEHGPTWILGMPFLRYYHTIFDRDSNNIYVRPATRDCTLGSSPANASTIFVKASAFGSGTAVTGSTSYTSTDFTPQEANLNHALLPAWAQKGKDDDRNMVL